jgi:hypothetical protein
MTSSPTDAGTPLAKGVTVSAETLVVELSDGRALRIPLAWYPRLAHGSEEERADWRMSGERSLTIRRDESLFTSDWTQALSSTRIAGAACSCLRRFSRDLGFRSSKRKQLGVSS